MLYDVIIYGPIFCDLIFTDLPGLPALGTEIFAGDLTVTVGGSAIVAVGLHRLGAKVGLAADLGTDAFSLIMRQTLDDLRLDRSLIREHDHPLPQATVGLSFPQDRAFVTRFARPKTPPDLAQLLHDHPTRHLHVSSFLAALDNPHAAHIAHDAGATVSMDPGWDEVALRDPQLMGMIREVDFFLPSEMEVRHIAAEDNLSVAATKVASTMRQDATLVVKQGANGATAFVHGGRDAVHTGVLPVTPVDTTGAGDSFDAGFLYAYVNGLPLDECMRYGAVCGGLSTTGPGGIGALPTLSEVTSWLPKLPSSAVAAPTHQD